MQHVRIHRRPALPVTAPTGVRKRCVPYAVVPSPAAGLIPVLPGPSRERPSLLSPEVTS